jgi:CO/xanthine dehydrogenase FAD-binding subunit
VAFNRTRGGLFQELISLFLRPGTLDEALQMLAQTRATILSGGTDIFPAFIGGQIKGPVLDISGVAEIKGIRTSQDFLEICGRTTWTEILTADLPRGFDGLRAAAREVGSIQIQNTATIAGNICNASPAADGVAALLALDAQLTLASHKRTRTLALADFVRGNRQTALEGDEILISVRIPRTWENAASSFLKLGARRYLVISIVMVAASLNIGQDRRIHEAAICVGSCSARARRLPELEQCLIGEFADSAILDIVKPAHLATLSPIDDIRATAEYRVDAAQTLVRRAIDECIRKVL